MCIISKEEVNTTWMWNLGFLLVDPVMTRFTKNPLGLGRKDI